MRAGVRHLPGLRTHLRAILVCGLAAGFPASNVSAQGAGLPSDPIAPKTMQECQDLRARYDALARQLTSQAKAMGDQAWNTVVTQGQLAADPYYQRSHRLHQEARNVYNQASSAWARCAQQVQAYQRAVAARKRQDDEARQRGASDGRSGALEATRKAVDGLFGSSGEAVGRGAAMDALRAYSDLGGSFKVGGETFRRPTSAPGAAIATSLLRFQKSIDRLLAADSSLGYLRFAADAGAVSLGSESLGIWNRLQTMLVRLSLGAITDIHQSALADLRQAMGEFSELGRLETVDTQSQVPNFSINQPKDDFARQFHQAVAGAKAQVARRGEASQQAMKSAQKKNSTVQQGTRSSMGKTTRSTSKRNKNTKYSASVCRNLASLIKEEKNTIQNCTGSAEWCAGIRRSLGEAVSIREAEYRLNCQ